MALVVVEELLAGLDEVKSALDQAIIILTALIDEADPGMAPQVQEVLAHTLLSPLTAHSVTVAQLQAALAGRG